MLCWSLGSPAVAQNVENQAPVIRHEPVRVAARGQPITVLATVTDDSGSVRSVTLFYSLSQDAAPFRTAMKSSGADLFYGTIPANMISGAASISYYIEAMDHVDAASETSWHTVDIKAPAEGAAPSAKKGTPAPVVPAPETSKPEKKSNILGISLIAGTAAAVAGVALWAANEDKDDDSDSSGDGVTAGDYSGSVTECFTLTGGTPTCSSHSMSISIGSDGEVSSSNLKEGYSLSTTLSGSSFTLVADLTGSSTGQVYYSGTVKSSSISGTITGSADTPEGAGTYSGTFSASKN